MMQGDNVSGSRKLIRVLLVVTQIGSEAPAAEAETDTEATSKVAGSYDKAVPGAAQTSKRIQGFASTIPASAFIDLVSSIKPQSRDTVSAVVKFRDETGAPATRARLTRRECEVLAGLIAHLTDREIAAS